MNTNIYLQNDDFFNMVSSVRKFRILSLATLIWLTMFTQVFMHATATKGSYPGANGLIAFSDYDGSDWEIFIMNSDGTGVTQLTFNEQLGETSPCWSPDGEWIAFTSEKNSAIWVINVDGTGLRQVTVPPVGDIDDDDPAWSLDGETILFFRWRHTPPSSRDIYKIDAQSTGPGDLFIEEASAPSWSPDGSMIAYHNWTDNNIWVADSSTGTPLFRVTSDGGYDPCWSPDGQRIVYLINNKIWVINVDGLNKQQFSFPPVGYDDGDPNWSPDGSKILFDREEDSIWIVNPDGTGAYDFTPSLPDAVHPDWQTLPVLELPIGGEITPKSTITLLAPYFVLITITLCVGYGVLNRRKLQ